MKAKNLILRYKGWAVVRIPTDPDPSDEPNGASGYTFAFAGEPRLDRIFRLQPDPEYIRPGPGYNEFEEWPWGVNVFEAALAFDDGSLKPLPEFEGAAVDMLGHPKLENRNWLLTYPGWEPFVPYEIQIRNDTSLFQRAAPLSADGTPYWQLPTSKLMTQAARGVYMEKETIGTATGIWDAMALYRDRLAWLEQAITKETDPIKKQALDSRQYEVSLGLSRGPADNRIGAHFAVERFDFGVNGNNAQAHSPVTERYGQFDLTTPWWSSFFFGCFDCDLLGTYVQGMLQIPFVQGTKGGAAS